jgi:hypothetical protein
MKGPERTTSAEVAAARQRRGKGIAMSEEERNSFLTAARTCRMATVGRDGHPHVTPLWFVWDTSSMWISSIVRSQRWIDVTHDGRVAIVVDAGESYDDLRGVEITGQIEVVGEVPRTGASLEALEVPERLYATKYAGGQMHYDGRHAWLRVVPDKIVTWDFRKRPTT